jgi:ubiquinone/menaquinone biosynthesis C-methylase UbiE/DNA-binding transcriptional ArsR family regulator
MNTYSPPPVLERLSALGDETRLRLLALLERSEFTVGELCGVLHVPQPTVSRQLKVLASEGWVAGRIDGRNRHYRLRPDLDDSARALWRIVREGLGQDGPWQTDAERARVVLDRRRMRATAFFAETAGRWDDMRSELFGVSAALAPMLGLVESSWIVGDLGAGSGALSARIAPFARTVIGVDRSEEMLATARARTAGLSNVELRRGELERLPIDDGALDLAIVALVLHYVVDPLSVLAEARRVLAPGGRLVLLDMREHDLGVGYAREMGHVWPGFEAGRVAAWLRDAGFTAARVTPLPPDPEASGPLLFLASARA